MKQQITTLSTYVKKKLHLHNNGPIHSVYRKTVNLSFDGDLVAIQAEGTPLSPVSLLTGFSQDEMAQVPFRQGDTVIIQDESLVFSLWYTVIFTSRFHRSFSPVPELSGRPNPLYDTIGSAIHRADNGGFQRIFVSNDLSDEPIFLIAAKNILTQAETQLTSGDWNGAAEKLIRLIGLGIGLTPSGDDFLTGVLAGLLLCGLQSHPFTAVLKQQIRTGIANTNDISQAFFRCALDGQFSRAICSLPACPDTDAVLQAFSEIGHSSGMDSLCGIYAVLNWLPIL